MTLIQLKIHIQAPTENKQRIGHKAEGVGQKVDYLGDLSGLSIKKEGEKINDTGHSNEHAIEGHDPELSSSAFSSYPAAEQHGQNQDKTYII